MMVPCPKCKSKIEVDSDERPIKIECPNCGAKGTIKGKKEEKDKKEKKKEKKGETLEDAKVIEHEAPEKEKVIEVDEEGKDDTYHEPTKKLWEPGEGDLPLEGAVVDEPVDEEERKKKPPRKEGRKKKRPPEKTEKGEKKKKPPAKEEKKKKPAKIKCKNCGGTIFVKTSKRPVKVECPKCGRKGTLKH